MTPEQEKQVINLRGKDKRSYEYIELETGLSQYEIKKFCKKMGLTTRAVQSNAVERKDEN